MTILDHLVRWCGRPASALVPRLDVESRIGISSPGTNSGPLVEAIGKHVFAGRKLHADDTPMPVLAPGNGKTKTGRL